MCLFVERSQTQTARSIPREMSQRPSRESDNEVIASQWPDCGAASWPVSACHTASFCAPEAARYLPSGEKHIDQASAPRPDRTNRRLLVATSQTEMQGAYSNSIPIATGRKSESSPPEASHLPSGENATA